MKLLKSRLNKTFLLRDSKNKLFNQEFIVGDEYLEDEFTEKNFEILKNYKYHGGYVFDLFDVEDEKKAQKKQPQKKKTITPEFSTKDIASLSAEYEEKFGKEVPRNKKNDEVWIESKLQEETPAE